jgi:hypothetical protein
MTSSASCAKPARPKPQRRKRAHGSVFARIATAPVAAIAGAIVVIPNRFSGADLLFTLQSRKPIRTTIAHAVTLSAAKGPIEFTPARTIT